MVYVVFFLLVAAFCKTNKKWSRAAAAILIFILLGFRNGVGTDFWSYVRDFNYGVDRYELGFRMICEFLYSHHASYQWMFVIMAFITIAFMYFALNNKNIRYVPTAILCYLMMFALMSNVVRQTASVAIFMYAYKFIEERKLLPYLACCILCVLFHNIMWLVIPLYFFINNSFKPIVYIAIYAISFSFIVIDIDSFVGNFLPFIVRYFGDYYAGHFISHTSFMGFGIIAYLVFYIITFILLIYYKEYEKHPVLFNLFLIAIVFFNLRISSMIFTRFEAAFNWSQYFLIPLLCCDKEIPKAMRDLMIFGYAVAFMALFFTNFVKPENLMIPYNWGFKYL